IILTLIVLVHVPLIFPLHFSPYFAVPTVFNIQDLLSFPTRRSSDLKQGDDVSRMRHAMFRASFPSRQSSFRPANSTTFFHLSVRSEEHTSELQSRFDLVCRLLLEKKKVHTESNFYNTYST